MFQFASLTRSDKNLLVIVGIIMAVICTAVMIHCSPHPRTFSQQELRRLHKAAEWQQTHPETFRQIWRDIDRNTGQE